MPERLSICVCTAFYPSTGGIETLAEDLADHWTAVGHRVTIVTSVAASAGPPRRFDYEVLHRPSPVQFLQTVRRCDVLVHNNVSLKSLWPLACVRRPLIAVHQSCYGREKKRETVRDRWKLHVAHRWAHNISASYAVQRTIEADGAVIPNPFDDARFRLLDGRRDKDLIFVGRLVSEKGADVLLRALTRLRSKRICPTLSIVGDGPERPLLEQMVRDADLRGQVSFCGWKNHDELPRFLNEHRIMVVPSAYNEPFGIVALEGAACGCVVVGSAGGGLPEAIGPCGVTFPNRDDGRLAETLETLLEDPGALEQYRVGAAAHLAAHKAEVISARYIEFFRQSLIRSGSRESCKF